MSGQTSEKLKQLIEKRRFYQATMYRMKEGANKRYYENLLSKNTYEIIDLGGNVFDIDDAGRAEVEAWGQRMADMSVGAKLAAVLRYWAPVVIPLLMIIGSAAYFVLT